MKHPFWLTFLLYILITCGLHAQNPDHSGKSFSTDTITLHSEIFSENWTILIFRPEGITSSDTVSVLFMPDGEFSAFRFGQIDSLKGCQIIGVGIVNTNRRRDLLPVNQADRFSDFIEKELIPKIEGRFTVQKRILFGHSFGGAFTLYIMINKPGLFDLYIASSPTPIMNLVDTTLYLQLDNELTTDINLFLSYGSRDMRQVKKWTARFIRNLSSTDLHRIHWTDRVFEGENHNTSDSKAIQNVVKY